MKISVFDFCHRPTPAGPRLSEILGSVTRNLLDMSRTELDGDVFVFISMVWLVAACILSGVC